MPIPIRPRRTCRSPAARRFPGRCAQLPLLAADAGSSDRIPVTWAGGSAGWRGSLRVCVWQSESMVQPALAACRSVHPLFPDPRGRNRKGFARGSGAAATFHQPVSRHAGGLRIRRRQLGFLPGLVWSAFLQRLFHDLHHPRRDQILSDHPRLYWTRHSTPWEELGFGSRGAAPRIRVDGEAGLDQPSGAGRPARGFATLDRSGALVASSFEVLWLLNGLIFYVLLFAGGAMAALVPTSWEVFPNALSTLIRVSVVELAGRTWMGGLQRGLQLIAYFVTVFIAAPLALITGLGHVTRAVGTVQAHQQTVQHPDRPLAPLPRARLVPRLHRPARDLRVHDGAAGQPQPRLRRAAPTAAGTGFWLFAASMVIMVVGWVGATPLCRTSPPSGRAAGRTGDRRTVQRLFEHVDPKPGEYSEKDISPYFWHNGQCPGYRRVQGAVRQRLRRLPAEDPRAGQHPVELSLAQLRALPRSRADHPARFLHRPGDMSWRREMGRRCSAAGFLNLARRISPRRSRSCLLLPRRRGRQGRLLRHPVERMSHQAHDDRLTT